MSTEKLLRAIKSILVAVDDSEPARWAADEAVRLAEALDARVSLVHVIDVIPALPTEFAFDDELKHPTLVEAARELLHRMADRVPVELLGEQILKEGNTAKQIIVASHESRADLLVIGTHGRGPLCLSVAWKLRRNGIHPSTVKAITPSASAPGARFFS